MSNFMRKLSSESEDEDTSPFIALEKGNIEDGRIGRTVWSLLVKNFWVAVSILLAITTSLLLVKQSERQAMGSFEVGFATDLEPARKAVGLQRTTFTGGLDLDEHGKLYRVTQPGEAQYVGAPSDRVDDAWENLMQASEIVLSGNEATAVVQTSAEEPEGKAWRLELDVYHSLHCVNEIRKALDADYYFTNGSIPYFYRVHIDHCLDYLRQAVQCQSDMTPLTFYWNTKAQAYLPNFEHTHTCRDFDKVHRWSLLRKASGSMVGHEHGT